MKFRSSNKINISNNSNYIINTIVLISIIISSIFLFSKRDIQIIGQNAQAACNDITNKSAALTDGNQFLPVSSYDYSGNNESRPGKNTLTHHISNVLFNSNNDFYLTGGENLPTDANLVNEGFTMDDGYILSLKRTKDENNVPLPTPEYYTSNLVNFLNIEKLYAYPNDTNMPRQLLLTGADTTLPDRDNEGPHSQNMIYFDKYITDGLPDAGAESQNYTAQGYTNNQYINSPINESNSAGGNIGLFSSTITVGSTPAADLPDGFITTARSLNITSYKFNGVQDTNFNPDTELLRKVMTDTHNNGGPIAHFFFPYDFKKKMRDVELQPLKYLKLPDYYKNISDLRSYYANPNFGLVAKSSLPLGLYDITFDVIDTGQVRTINNGIKLKYTERDPSCGTTPVVNGGTVSCQYGNPFRINFSFSSTAGTGNILSNSVVLTSLSDGKVINYNTGSTNPFTQPDYKITRTLFTPAATTSWDFYIDFVSGSSYFNSFYNSSGGFNVSLTITDNASTYVNPVNALITGAGRDPSTGCTSPFFKSGNGSFRSNESIGATNGYWIKNINDGTSIRHTNGNDPYSVSDFTYESKLNNNSCKTGIKGTKQLDSNFCIQMPSDGYAVTRDKTIYDITKQEFRSSQNCGSCILNDPINGVKYFNITVRRDRTIDVNPKADSLGHSIPNPYNNALLNTLFPGNDPSTFTINLQALRQINLLETYISFAYDFPINNIIIMDDSNSAAVGTAGVFCEIKDCKMNIMSYKAYPPSSVVFDKAADKVTYDLGNTGFKTTQVNRIRTYVNYHDGEISNSNTSPSTNTREINLISTDNSMSNYYMGNFYTNGFLYTDKSKYTSIIKGNIISRGIVSYSTNGLLSGTSFRDYNKPFLYMEYDPKFYIPYNILENRIGTDLKYIGL